MLSIGLEMTIIPQMTHSFIKINDGENKDPDEYGYRWTKIKRDLTDDEQSTLSLLKQFYLVT